MRAQHLHDADLARLAAGLRGLHFLEDLGLLHMAADVQRHGNDQQAHGEGHAPGPGHQFLLGEDLGDQRARGRADQQGQHLAGHLPGTIEAALAGRCQLDQQCRGRAELAAGRKALQQPRQHDEQRRQDAHRRIRGRQRDQRDGHGHQAGHHHHGRLATLAVPVQAQQDAAHGPHEKAHAEHGRGHQDAVDVVVRIVGIAGEEQLGDDGCHEGEHQEVIPLQRVADDGSHDVAGRDGLLGQSRVHFRKGIEKTAVTPGAWVGVPARAATRAYTASPYAMPMPWPASSTKGGAGHGADGTT